MQIRVIRSLMKRSLLCTCIDQGRLADLLLFPISSLVIWGLLVYSGMLQAHLAEQLLLINLVWALASSFQMQANYTLMYDLWSEEFPEMVRAGVRPSEYFLATLGYGAIVGCFNVAIFVLSITFVFSIPFERSLFLVYLLPAYGAASLGLAAMVAGLVVLLGRSYGFLTWTILQILIMLSSPYAPLESLPLVLKWIALVSPFGGLFEYIRTHDSTLLIVAMIESGVMFLLGCYLFTVLYELARKRGKLVLL